MERKLFQVRQIRGDYALLQGEAGVETEMALALLPEELEEGDTVVWEDFTYSILGKEDL